MRNQLEGLMQASDVTTFCAARISEGRLTETYYIGDTHADMNWPVASLTKPVFAYGVMLLVESGLLDLDRPLHSYLTNPYLDDVELLPHMTTRHALSHTTGFPNWRDAQGLRATFMPGTKFSYSSEGLTYLQHVVETIIQAPISVYLAEQVFRPLGMMQTGLKTEIVSDLPPMLHFLNSSLLANGALSMRTTLEDYTQFMIRMLDVTPTIAAMLQPQIAVNNVPNLHWGLGWGLQITSSDYNFWHWGARSIPKTMSFAIGFPDRQEALVIFTNHANGLSLCRSIVELWTDVTELPAFEWLLPAQEWRPHGKEKL